MTGEPEIVELIRFRSPGEAEVARSRLEAEGIPAWVESDDVGGMHPHLGAFEGARVLVRGEDLERATELLDVAVHGESVAPPPDFADGEAPPRASTLAGSFVPLLLIVGVSFLAGFLVSESRVFDPSRYDVFYADAMEFDENRDGRPDTWAVYRGPDLQRMRVDRDFDGEADEWHAYRDGVGIASEYDDDFDGRAEFAVRYRFGRVEAAELDVEGDGVADASEIYRHGVLVEERWHPGGGPVERIDRFEAGRLRSIETVAPDGSTRVLARFDRYGRPVE